MFLPTFSVFESIFVAIYDVSPLDEPNLDEWESADSGLNFVIKTTVFLQSMGDFAAMNAVYGTYFKEKPPARATVEVARLPKDVLVEIDVIALG